MCQVHLNYSYYHFMELTVYILIYIAILKEYLDLYIVRYKNHNTSFITQKP